MRYFLAIYVFVIVTAVSILGFRGRNSEKPPLRIFPDMDEQAYYKPQRQTDFFEDGRQDRPPVPNTVATIPDHLSAYAKYDTFTPDRYYATGKTADGEYGEGIPVEVTEKLVHLGQKKYEIHCVSCHATTGDGNGITKAYGMTAVPSYHQERLRKQPEGKIFETITYGRGLMGPYRAKLRVKERWAVIAYVRSLQLARQGSVEDVPEKNRKALGL